MEYCKCKIENATDGTMISLMNDLFNCDLGSEDSVDLNSQLVKYVIDNTVRCFDGRLVMPALWNTEIINNLPKNYNIALNVLKSQFKKFIKDRSRLNQYDEVIQQQLKDGIIELIPELDSVVKDESSFIAHSAIFKESSSTTKCRIVLLSNLCDRGENNLSHNKVSLPGPNLNSKSYIACTLLRFNRFLFIFDLVKAYLQLKVRNED